MQLLLKLSNLEVLHFRVFSLEVQKFLKISVLTDTLGRLANYCFVISQFLVSCNILFY